MSFIVKGLNMPKDGNSIDISVQDSGAVLVKSSEGYYEFKGNIAVEIPTPHGRLIDGDALERYIEGRGFVIGYKAIDDQKVILEAEE